MYLKKHKRFKDGKDHVYWSLMETVRTSEGPRQKRLCYLGELNHSRKKSWRKAIEVLNGDGRKEQLFLFPDDAPPEEGSEDFVSIDLKSICLKRAREFGAVYMAWGLWKKLELDKFWQSGIRSLKGSRIPQS